MTRFEVLALEEIDSIKNEEAEFKKMEQEGKQKHSELFKAAHVVSSHGR